eukprot:489978_1
MSLFGFGNKKKKSSDKIYQAKLHQLEVLGYKDKDKNLKLLKLHKGDVNLVIKDIGYIIPKPVKKYFKKKSIQKIPFLCPPKYHYVYYKSLLYSTTSMYSQFDFLSSIILDFCCGELDFSKQFFQSNTWNNIKAILNDTETPCFSLTTSCTDSYHTFSVDSSTSLDINECYNIISKMSPEELDDNFEKNYFEAIWYWNSEGSMMNAGDYGEFRSQHTFYGVLNPQIFQTKTSGNKIIMKISTIKDTDDYDIDGTYKLNFFFSDNVEHFWSKINWKYYHPDQVKQFDPNIYEHSDIMQRKYAPWIQNAQNR